MDARDDGDTAKGHGRGQGRVDAPVQELVDVLSVAIGADAAAKVVDNGKEDVPEEGENK